MGPKSILPGSLQVQTAPMPDTLVPEKTHKKYSQYYRDVRHLEYVDIYRLLDLFNVTDPAVQHAVKKLLLPGVRTGGKLAAQDIKEAIVSLNRCLEMMEEDSHKKE